MRVEVLEWRGEWFGVAVGDAVRAVSAFRGTRREAVRRAAEKAGAEAVDAGSGEASEELRMYLDEGEPLSLEASPRGTDFQEAVWGLVAGIPFGETRSYGEVARGIGRPGAARAVGNAVGANPAPLVVPCHRVVAGAGLGGYGPGMERKRSLLELEGALGEE